ncbi:MAG: hypothetical protein QNL33_20125, partial [Akkermansiaceae bacterium]
TIGKEAIAVLKVGTLVLRDMGYFSLAEFSEIERQLAFWLTRLPLTTADRVVSESLPVAS